MARYKVGERIVLRQDLKQGKKYGEDGIYYIDDMSFAKNRPTEISEVIEFNEEDAMYVFGDVGHIACDEMIDHILTEAINIVDYDDIFLEEDGDYIVGVDENGRIRTLKEVLEDVESVKLFEEEEDDYDTCNTYETTYKVGDRVILTEAIVDLAIPKRFVGEMVEIIDVDFDGEYTAYFFEDDEPNRVFGVSESAIDHISTGELHDMLDGFKRENAVEEKGDDVIAELKFDSDIYNILNKHNLTRLAKDKVIGILIKNKRELYDAVLELALAEGWAVERFNKTAKMVGRQD